ncbi:MAG: nucleotidyltransferase family protein [Bacteroidales bacterium]|nr:nucleotidyltransferase family protein [Bacteroidales bacterium]
MVKMAEIRNEEIVLLGLSRLHFNEELTGKISALLEEITDWDYFTRLASEHGIAALVYYNLQQLGLIAGIPPEKADILHSSLLLSITRNAFHLTGAEDIISLLNSEGIKSVLLKGLALETTVYGNKGLRQMTDVDLLISRNDYLRARKILMENGFDSNSLKSGLHKPIMAWTGKHLPSLMRNGLSADIHLELFPGRKNSLTSLMIDSARETMLERVKAFVPDPQLLFLYLVRHLYNHELNEESQLRLYADLVVLIEVHREEILNYELLRLAGEAGMSRILAWKLEPLRDLWGIDFPSWLNDFVSRWFNPESINRFVFFLKSPKGNPVTHPGRAYRKIISEIPGIHRKALFILGDIFPSISFMKERYNVKSTLKALMFYPLRFGKMLRLISR